MFRGDISNNVTWALPRNGRRINAEGLFRGLVYPCLGLFKCIPSGNLTKSYGKSPFFMGKSTISMAIFNCYVSSPEGKPWFLG